MRVFLDTNVWIDFIGERQPFYEAAATIMTYADEKKCSIVVSSLSIVNAQYICCERSSMPLAVWRHKMNSLKDLVEICSADRQDIYGACDSFWDDFEDCVQYQAAKRNGCSIIVTRNPKDYVQSDIMVMSPDQAIKLLATL